jgi:predicted transcriptional regulator
MEDKAQLVELTADIAAAYLSANTVPAGDLPGLIQTIHQALSGVSSGAPAPAAEPAKPAVPVKKSITPDYLISLEDGKRYKSLKRHLRTKYNMTPDEYRSKWGLPKDYPMVAPNYAKARSEMARNMGLVQGGRGRKPAAAKAAAAPKAAKAAKAPKAAKAAKAPKAPKAAKAAAPAKRGPGRPPKAKPAAAAAAPAKRGPGRPKKNK